MVVESRKQTSQFGRMVMKWEVNVMNEKSRMAKEEKRKESEASVTQSQQFEKKWFLLARSSQDVILSHYHSLTHPKNRAGR